MKTFALLLAVIGLTPTQALAVCNGPSPAVTGATVRSVQTDGKQNFYQIAATVKNEGSAQASNTLQFLDIYMAQEKLDAKGIPPLAPGGVYTVLYTSHRSVDAGKNTTALTFKLDPACDGNAGQYTILF